MQKSCQAKADLTQQLVARGASSACYLPLAKPLALCSLFQSPVISHLHCHTFQQAAHHISPWLVSPTTFQPWPGIGKWPTCRNPHGPTAALRGSRVVLLVRRQLREDAPRKKNKPSIGSKPPQGQYLLRQKQVRFGCRCWARFWRTGGLLLGQASMSFTATQQSSKLF